MPDLAAFPDVEIALRAVLADLVPDSSHIATRVPADPAGTLSWLPFIRVSVTGGSDNMISDLSRVDVECFADSQGAAAGLAESVRQRILFGGRPHVDTDWVLDRAATDVKPHYVPYVDNPPPYRYAAAYSVSARR